MNYHKLGQSNLQISAVSFGCMSLKGKEADDIQLLHQALAGGINFFDTADLYDRGANEELVGKAFKQKRKEVIIATKAGNQWRPDGSGWDWNTTKAYILQAAEKSLRRLQTDYIDLYQLHGGTLEDPTDETIEAFEQLQQQGKIRYYGISSIRPNVVQRWVERSKMSSVMLQYSLLDRRPEEAILPLLQEKNIGVLVRGALAQGLLTGKPQKPYLEHSEEAVQKAAAAVAAASTGGHTGTSVSLHWVLQQQAVSSAVVGIRTQEHLIQALVAAQKPAITPETYAGLSNAAPPLTYQQHR
jgi:aryl-alcohol dehydrogenase-like predicted oxidoreductase